MCFETSLCVMAAPIALHGFCTVLKRVSRRTLLVFFPPFLLFCFVLFFFFAFSGGVLFLFLFLLLLLLLFFLQIDFYCMI